ncbi:hypothetical protein ACMBCM_07770, partial [Spiroplasma sp. K1]
GGDLDFGMHAIVNMCLKLTMDEKKNVSQTIFQYIYIYIYILKGHFWNTLDKINLRYNEFRKNS